MKNNIVIATRPSERLAVRQKATLFLFLFIVLLSGNGIVASAQDLIILKNGDEINASVIEIGIEQISYKRSDNLSGPLYNLEKSKVFMIKYQNGTKDVFDAAPEILNDKIAADQVNVAAKVSNEPIMARGAKIWQSGEKLSPVEVRRLLAPFPKALHSYNSGRVLNGFDWAVSMAGIAVFSTFIALEAGFWTAFAAMSPFLIGDTILGIFAQKNINASVSLYNFSISNQTSYKLDFGIHHYGIGIALRF